jgi:branched-chain amino acid transport system permease protein
MVLVAASIALMAGMQAFVSRTMYGKAMRAVSIDMGASRLMGIDVDRVIALTFFMGSALAAGGGVMAGAYYGSVHFFMGFIMGLKAFTAAVIGGIGSVPGAMLGGLLLGLLEAFGSSLPFVGSEWRDVFVFGTLILFLVFKPTGLLGRSVVERV